MAFPQPTAGTPSVPFERFLNDFWQDSWLAGSWPSTAISLPAANIEEQAAAFHIELAVPGMTKQDFTVQLTDGVLTVSAVKQQDSSTDKAEAGRYRRREFNYQAFSRSFTLPAQVDTQRISARYSEGILHLHLPKKAAAQQASPTRQVAIA